jgi:hypothetical protein
MVTVRWSKREFKTIENHNKSDHISEISNWFELVWGFLIKNAI